MLLRVTSKSLRAHAAYSLRTSAFSTARTAVAAELSTPAEHAALPPRDRERRRKERAEQEPAIGIEGIAEFYTRQLVVVDNEASAPLQWPKKIEFSDHVVSHYAKAIAAVESPKLSTLRTIAATPFPAPCASAAAATDDDDTAERQHDLLVFPEHIRVQGIAVSHIPSLVSQILQPNPDVRAVLDSLNLPFQTLDEGHHILVCAHESRDERCGCNGPKLLRWLQDVGAKKSVPLHLYSSSHFGGHRYAANCITYPSGDWFGLLNEPADADALVAALEDEQPLRLQTQWRGRIAVKKENQLRMLKDAVAKTRA